MKRTFLLFLVLGFAWEGYGQNAIVGTDFSIGWGGGSCPTGNSNFTYLAASSGTSYIVSRNATATGNRFFRFGIDFSGTTAQRTLAIGTDITVNINQTYTLDPNCTTSGAMIINVGSTAYNYVFKTLDIGTNPTGTFVVFEVQDAIRTVTSVSQNPVAGSVYINQPVVITANMSDNQSTGQNVYLRYSTDNFTTSMVVPMTYTGTTATASIPGSANTGGSTISYYVFTSGTANVAANGSNSDLYTINLNNNGGSNYSYTVQNAYASSQTGTWNTGTTWLGGAVPPTGANIIIQNTHNVTLDVNATVASLTINTGGTFTASDASPRTFNIFANVTGTTLTNNGSWAIGTGGSTIDFRSDNTITHTISGTIGFQNVTITRNSGTPNIGVNFGTASTINGNFQINAGGFVATNAPTYASGSTLVYATGTTYGRSDEWITNNPQNVIITNGTTLDIRNASVAARTMNGNLIIETGSAASMGNMTGALTVGGNVEINGTLTLSSTANGNLNLAGNFTNSGTFIANGRTVTFNGTANQTITGNTTFSTIVNSNTSGVVNIPVGTTITVTSTGTFSTANSTTSVDGTISNQGVIAGLSDAIKGLRFNATGIYNHNVNGNAIPFATWALTSNCNINGVTSTFNSTIASSFAQNFGNLTWNCTGQTVIANFTGNLTSITGNLNIQSTGSNVFRLNSSSPTSVLLNIGGELNQSGGTIDLTNGTSTVTLNVSGNFIQSGGALNGSITTSGTGVINVTGNFTQTDGTIIGSTASGTGTFNVTGNFTQSAGTINGTTSTGTGNFNVLGNFTQTGGTINLGGGSSTGTGILRVAGSFTQSSGTIDELNNSNNHTIEFNGSSNQSISIAGTVNNRINYRCNNSNGITLLMNLIINQDATFFRSKGSITGLINYNTTNSTLVYDGESLTTSDIEWPSAAGPVNITINAPDPANIITLNANKDVTTSSAGTLTLTSGKLAMANFNLSVLRANTAAISGGTSDNSYVLQNGTGRLKRSIPVILSGTQNYVFPLGTSSGITGITFSFTGTNCNTDARNLTVATNGGTTNMFLPNTPPDYLSRYFTTSLDDENGNYIYRVSSLGYISGEETGNTNLIKISSFNSLSTTWTDLTTFPANPFTSSSGTYTKANAPLSSGHFSGRNSSALYTWTGLTNTNWATTTNWSPNGLPSPTDRVIINVPGNYILTLTDDCTINQVTLTSSGVLTINNGGILRTPNFTFDDPATLNMSAGAELHLETNVTYTGTPNASLDCGSTVFYERSGTTDQIIIPLQYGNLNVVGGDRTFVSGVTTSICGTYTPTTGASTLTGSTVVFNGASLQEIPTDGYVNLQISNSSGDYCTLGGNISVSGSLVVDAGSKLNSDTRTVNISGSTSVINGTWKRGNGTFTQSTGSLSFGPTGVYEHNINGGSIPTATWNSGSTCMIIGAASAGPSVASLGQSFHHFIWNCSGQTSSVSLGGGLTTINGDFEIRNTANNDVNLITSSGTSNLTVNGKLWLSGGNLSLTSGTIASILNLEGDLEIANGYFIKKTGSGSGLINFKGSSLQTLTFIGSGSLQNAINLTIDNPAGITLAANTTLPVNANSILTRVQGNLTAASGAGISYGNNSALLSYASSGSTALTTTSVEWPASNGPSRVEINSSSSEPVMLHETRSLPGNSSNICLVLTSGRIGLGNNNLFIENNATGAISGGSTSAYVQTDGTGLLVRNIAGGGGNYQYPLGNGTTMYTPAGYNFSSNSVANRQLGVRSGGSNHPNMGTAPADRIDGRYWVTSLVDNSSGTYAYTPSYTFITSPSSDLVGATGNIRLSRYTGVGTTWGNFSASTVAGNVLGNISLSETAGPLAAGAWAGRAQIAPAIYTWTSATDGAWDNSSNWNPANIPSNEDGVIFNHTGSRTISNVPMGIRLSVMQFSNEGTTTLLPGTTGSIFIGGGTSPQLSVAANTSLIISGNNPSNWFISSGNNALVVGKVVLRGISGNTSHTLQGQIAGAVTFSDGSKFEAGVFNTTNFSGNPFGSDGTAGSVVFQTGSVFEQFDGSNPFGNNNAAVFQSGSLYRYSDNAAISDPSFSGRTYSNFEYNSSYLAGKTVTATNAFSIDNLLVSQGTLNINVTGTPGHSIKGNITVASGANLNFNPSGAGTVLLNGNSAQTISGDGTLTLGTFATWQVTNNSINGVSLQKNITVNGTLNISANAIFNATGNNVVSGSGNFNLQTDGFLGVGSPDGLFGSTSSGNIQTTNRTVSSGASVRYNGTGLQTTGNFSTTPTTNALKGIYINNPAGVSLSSNNNNITLSALTLETGAFSIGSGQQVNMASGGSVNGSGGDFANGANGGTVNFTGAGSFSGSCNPYNVYTSGGVNFGIGMVTIQDGGAFRINAGGFANINGPFYAIGSTLEYNTGGSFIAGTEWYALFKTGRGVPHHVQIGRNGVNNSQLIFGGSTAWRYATGNISIGDAVGGAGFNFSLATTGGGDVRLEGNWIRHSNATFTPNNRSVTFTGNGNTQSITRIGGGTETFAYLILEKPFGDVQLTALPATDVTLNGSLGGDVLQLLQGNLDLNGRLFQLGGAGGNFRVNGALRQVYSATPAIFRVIGDKEITSTGGGTLLFDNQTTVEIAAGLNFGPSVTTINATLQINAGGFANVNAPIYGINGRLVYNTGGTYLRRVEWNGNVEDGPGYPNDVVLQNSTTLWASGSGGENAGTLLSAERDVLIGPGSELRMDGTHDMLVPLVAGRNLTIEGILAASNNANGNVFVGQNWFRGTSGNFIHNNRAVFFNTSQVASIGNAVINDIETFPYVIVDKAGTADNTLTLAAPVDISGKFTLSSGRVITDGINVLTIINDEPDNSSNGVDYPDNNTGYVDGPMRRNVRVITGADADTSYLFPVGDYVSSSHYYRRFRLKNIDVADNTFSGEFFKSQPPGAFDGNDFFGNDIIGIHRTEYWEVEKELANLTTARLVVPYVNPGNSGWLTIDGSPTQPASDPKVNVAIVHSPVLDNWEYAGDGDGFDADPSMIEPEARPYNINGELKSRVVSKFSPFSIGFGYASILPLHLLTFTAALHGPDALLHFTLADANNLKQFEVEHSTDGQRFNRLATIGYNGGTDYHYRHAKLPAGVHYYRLKMVEKDGRSSYSKVEVLMVNTNQTLITGLMHNPIQGGQAVVKLFSASNQDAEVRVIDMAGRTLLRQKLLLQTGYNQPSLSLMLLPSGMYKMLIRTRDGVEKVISVVK